MTKFYFSFIFFTLLVFNLSTGPSVATDLAAGKAKAKTVCQTCHGMDGRATMPMVANISGQQEDYLIAQLKNFRAGKRSHAQMEIIAKMLSDEDIENVAKWYASIQLTLELPKGLGKK
jgi:cytochrome c553